MGGAGSDVLMNGWSLVFKKANDGVRSGLEMRLEFAELDDDAYRILEHCKESGEELFVTLIRGEILVHGKQPKGEHGRFAQRLMLSKLFCNPEFWVSVGTEEEYFAWVRKQPCCITGKMERNTDNGEDFTELAHVSSVKYGKGTGVKAPYFAVPMTQKMHRHVQHQNGIVSVWEKAGRNLPSGIQFPIENEVQIARYFLEMQALSYVREWVKEKIKSDLNMPSLSFCSPQVFEEYMESRGCAELKKFI